MKIEIHDELTVRCICEPEAPEHRGEFVAQREYRAFARPHNGSVIGFVITVYQSEKGGKFSIAWPGHKFFDDHFVLVGEHGEEDPVSAYDRAMGIL